MNEQTFTFPSSSGSGMYTARVASDGKLLCNCKGWTMRRGTNARSCKHTREVAKGRTTVERGEFTYLSWGPASTQIEVVPTPEPRGPVPRPMLASAMPERLTDGGFDVMFHTGWALEEKLDGHRVIVQVRGTGRFAQVAAFSRPAPNQAPKVRELPPAMVAALATVGDCDLDGELVAPTGKSWDVVVKGAQLVYVAFDITNSLGIDVMSKSYEDRRGILLDHLRGLVAGQQSVTTVLSNNPTWKEVQAIWARGGEGAILKRLCSRYQPGYRSPDWLKVKAEHTAVLTIIGFEMGKSGPYSTLRLRDAGGHETTVKTLGNQLLRDITAKPDSFIGREVVITYQERTPAGFYRHGRFDHFTKE